MDSMTLAISHREQSGMVVLDALREWRPPFDPNAVISGVVKVLPDREDYRRSLCR
jgi:hypothetical protein